MSSTKINAPSKYIVEIQYKLFDFDKNHKQKESETIENQKYHTNKDKNRNKTIKIFEDKYEFQKPVCPKCGCEKYIKNSPNPKLIVKKDQGKVKIRVQRYICKNCSVNYQTQFINEIKENSTYNNEIKEFIFDLFRLEHISLRNIAKILKIVYNIDISPQTLKNWL